MTGTGGLELRKSSVTSCPTTHRSSSVIVTLYRVGSLLRRDGVSAPMPAYRVRVVDARPIAAL